MLRGAGSEERLRLVLSSSRTRVWTLALPQPARHPAGAGIATDESIEGLLRRVHPEDRPVVEAAVGQALVAEAGEFSAEFRVVDEARERWVLGRGSVLRAGSGRPLAIAAMEMDITERRQAEQERSRLLAEAEEARSEAERANRLKDEFLATLSHELRTPLNAIAGWAHLLAHRQLSPSSRRARSRRSAATRELQKQLISEILDVSRIVTGKLRLELRPVDLRGVVRRGARHHAACGRGEGHRDRRPARARSEPRCRATPYRLQQVIWNLLSNAIKFTPPGGRIEVGLAGDVATLVLTVRDDGPGIAPEFLPYVFERFRQGDSSSTRPAPGAGPGPGDRPSPGRAPRGSVSAANRDDGPGAELTIVLPRSADLVAAITPAGPPAGPTSGRRRFAGRPGAGRRRRGGRPRGDRHDPAPQRRRAGPGRVGRRGVASGARRGPTSC